MADRSGIVNTIDRQGEGELMVAIYFRDDLTTERGRGVDGKSYCTLRLKAQRTIRSYMVCMSIASDVGAEPASAMRYRRGQRVAK